MKNYQKWTKAFSRPHTIQRVSFLWPFLKSGIPQNRSIKASEMLVLPSQERGRYDYFFIEEEWKILLDRMGKFMLEKSAKEQEKDFGKYAQDYVRSSREIYDENIENMSNKELIEWLKNYSGVYANYVLYALTPWAIDYVLAPKLFEELKLIDKERANQWIESISSPTRYNNMAKNRIELCKIAIDKDFSRLKEHTKKYCWLPVYNPGDSPWTEDNFREQIKQIENPKEEIDKLEKEFEQRKERYKKTMQEINPSRELKRLIETVHLYTFLRDERVDVWRLALYYIDKFYIGIARRAKISPEDSVNMFDEEIIGFLQDGRVPANIKERKIQHAIIYGYGKIKIITEKKEIENLKRNELGLKEKEASELKGFSAYKGIVKGYARVIKTPKDLSELKKGEILVAHHTSPEFVIAMKRASAIVTDEGGVTSHAAIVSRELKIPCITGTAEGSRIIKTGDLIEVDANTGVVRVLERK